MGFPSCSPPSWAVPSLQTSKHSEGREHADWAFRTVSCSRLLGRVEQAKIQNIQKFKIQRANWDVHMVSQRTCKADLTLPAYNTEWKKYEPFHQNTRRGRRKSRTTLVSGAVWQIRCHFLCQWSSPDHHGELSAARRMEPQPWLEKMYSVSRARMLGGKVCKCKKKICFNPYLKINVTEH